ncbi:MAG TPA: hypothetical protein VKZ53_11560 [Candidatus Angelobacter sp.]|nr:hypothetical protein [Candidatus Angelobacter sp.]
MQLHEVAVHREGKYKLVSAKTRSWERAEQKALVTGVGWALLYAHSDSESKWSQVVGNIVSE